MCQIHSHVEKEISVGEGFSEGRVCCGGAQDDEQAMVSSVALILQAGDGLCRKNAQFAVLSQRARAETLGIQFKGEDYTIAEMWRTAAAPRFEPSIAD